MIGRMWCCNTRHAALWSVLTQCKQSIQQCLKLLEINCARRIFVRSGHHGIDGNMQPEVLCSTWWSAYINLLSAVGHASVRPTQSQVHHEEARLHNLLELGDRDNATAVLLRSASISCDALICFSATAVALARLHCLHDIQRTLPPRATKASSVSESNADDCASAFCFSMTLMNSENSISPLPSSSTC